MIKSQLASVYVWFPSNLSIACSLMKMHKYTHWWIWID